jgi:hypothetical protein
MSERASRQQKARERLSAALRENLRRRKAQAKARTAEPAGDRQDRHQYPHPPTRPVDESAANPHDSAGFDTEK